MESVVGKMGQNFLVAAFIPSLAFTTIILFVFDPIIPPTVITRLQNTIAPLDHPALVLLIITVVIAFTLYSLNTAIYKTMEGYLILNRIPAITRFQRRKVLKPYIQIKLLEKLIEKNIQEGGDNEQASDLSQRLFQISAQYQLNYPLDPKSIMPTRFGNVLRAMEAYPRNRYEMDAVLLWPRLIHVIPPAYYAKLDQSNNGLAFLINCAILSLALALMSGFAALYQMLMLRLANANITEPLYFVRVDVSSDGLTKYQQNIYFYLAGIVMAMALFALFYRAAIPVAVQYSNLVRSAFDLFRWPLMNSMHIKTPNDYDEEAANWENLSMFIGHGLVGTDYEAAIPFHYGLPGETQENEAENNEDQNEATESTTDLLEETAELEGG
jgi:hypothetical protein